MVLETARVDEEVAMNWDIFFGVLLLGGIKVLFVVAILVIVLLSAL